MHLSLPVLLIALAVAGCSGTQDGAAPAAEQAATGYSADVRRNFLGSCLDNATNTANGAATREQLTQTCACILGKVEKEYSESDFAAFEQRLLGGTASQEESDRLTTWSTDCATEATG